MCYNGIYIKESNMENQNKEIVEKNEEQVENTEVVEEIVEEQVTETTDVEVVEEQKEEQPVEEEYVGKEVTTSIRYDFRTMKYFNLYNTVVRRKLPVWYIVMACLSLAFAIYTVVSGYFEVQKTEGATMTSSYVFGAIFLFFAIWLGKQAIGFEGFVDRQIRAHFAAHKVAAQHIRIREDKITLIPVNKPEESFSYDWSQITSIEEINEFFFLYIGKSPLIIDKDPSKMVEGTYEQMVEIFDEKIAVKPYKRYTKQVVKKPITYVHQEDLENDKNAVEVEAEEVQEVNQENND